MIKQAWNYKSLVAEGSSNSSGGGSDGAFTYKSKKVVYNLSNAHLEDEILYEVIGLAGSLIPIYSIYTDEGDSTSRYAKYYGLIATIKTVSFSRYSYPIYIEEAEGYGVCNYQGLSINTDEGIKSIVKLLMENQGLSTDDESVKNYMKDTLGLEQISYDEYIKLIPYKDNKYANF